jgi:hypothetical protein
MIFFGMFPSIKAMIIIAWNGSGKLSSIFEGDVFKKVLSIFITSTILNFGQGREKSSLKDFVFEHCSLFCWAYRPFHLSHVQLVTETEALVPIELEAHWHVQLVLSIAYISPFTNSNSLWKMSHYPNLKYQIDE